MIIRENPLSLIQLKSLEWPDHKYFELVEHFKPNSNVTDKVMFFRLSQLHQTFKQLLGYAEKRNIFLVRFSILLPQQRFIPEELQPPYRDFMNAYKGLEYKNGKDLLNQLDVITYTLLQLLQSYACYDDTIMKNFPLSETTVVDRDMELLWQNL
jgi:hypothetical protein